MYKIPMQKMHRDYSLPKSNCKAVLLYIRCQVEKCVEKVKNLAITWKTTCNMLKTCKVSMLYEGFSTFTGGVVYSICQIFNKMNIRLQSVKQ